MALNEDCLFCKIVKREVDAMTVWDDGTAVAFLDINPLQRGHTLVIPRTHAARFEDLTSDEAGSLAKAVREVTVRVQKGMNVAGTTIAVNNGEDAGQEVPHVHVHVVPRMRGDGAGPIHALFEGKAPDVPKDELADIQERIRNAK